MKPAEEGRVGCNAGDKALCAECREMAASLLDLHKLIRELLIENEHLRQALIRLHEGGKSDPSINQLPHRTACNGNG